MIQMSAHTRTALCGNAFQDVLRLEMLNQPGTQSVWNRVPTQSVTAIKLRRNTFCGVPDMWFGKACAKPHV